MYEAVVAIEAQATGMLCQDSADFPNGHTFAGNVQRLATKVVRVLCRAWQDCVGCACSEARKKREGPALTTFLHDTLKNVEEGAIHRARDILSAITGQIVKGSMFRATQVPVVAQCQAFAHYVTHGEGDAGQGDGRGRDEAAH